MSTKILLGGFGLTGSATSWFLHNAMQSSLKTFPALKILDQTEHMEGRLTTHRFTGYSASDNSPNTDLQYGQVDIGGQYLTRYHDRHIEVFNHLQHAGVITPFDATSGVIQGVKAEYAHLPHFFAPRGMSEIVHFFKTNTEKTQVHGSTRISAVNINNGKIDVTYENEKENISHMEQVDCLVLSIPPPSLLPNIAGNIWSVLAQSEYGSLTSVLQNVVYSSRFAVAAYYLLPTADVQRILGEHAWKIRYTPTDPRLRYISFENVKYDPAFLTNNTAESNSSEENTILSVLLHSSLDFYSDHQNTDNANAVTSALLDSMHQFVPALQHQTPVKTQLVPWKVSQTLTPFNASSVSPSSNIQMGNAIAVDVSPHARIVFAGDYFTTSNFEGSLDSAKDAAQHIANFLQRTS